MDIEARLRQLEARLSALEGQASSLGPRPQGAFWALDYLRQKAPPGGEVVFAGQAELAFGTFAWQWGLPVAPLLQAPWAEVADGLVALAHPLRLEILRAVLSGRTSAQDLQQLEQIGTTGQLYHHLKELQHSGWLRVCRRGNYAVPPERVIPLLVILCAAGGEALAVRGGGE